MRSSFINGVLHAWKQEAKVTHLMLYSFRNGILTIYTDRPGPLIGRGGALISKYSEILMQDVPFYPVKDVRLVETDGIF